MKTVTACLFLPTPSDPALQFSWPTNNQHLFSRPELFFARTRANPEYGRPGWTRECGKRFHRGCDIAPLNPRSSGETTRVLFTDCATGREYPSDERVWIPDDPVFAVAEGHVLEVNSREEASTLGRYVALEHSWPTLGGRFISLYAHLDSVDVRVTEAVVSGFAIGRMGRTSSSADARNWMAVAPHLHLEFRDGETNRCFDPEAMLRTFIRAPGVPLA